MKSITILKNLGNRQDRLTEEECYQLWAMLEYQKAALMQADINTLTKLVEVFAKAYWDSDMILPNNSLKDLLFVLPQEKQAEMIPVLLKRAKLYPKYVALANDLMRGFSEDEKKLLKIYPVRLADEVIGTFISKAEFEYCTRHGLRCFKHKESYCRPMRYQDLECFYDSMSMAYETGNPTYMYLG